MRNILIVAMFYCINTSAQCTLTWGHVEYDSIIANSKEYMVTDNYVVGTDGYKISKPFLDSLIQEVKIQKPPYSFHTHVIDSNGIKVVDSNGLVLWDADFEIFRLKEKEIVHYKSYKYLIEKDSINVHLFSYCDKEWNEDFPQNLIYYTEQFGIIGKAQTGGIGDPLSGVEFRLINNSCISINENKKMNVLISKINKR